jgi:trans-aconitate methyltransferase
MDSNQARKLKTTFQNQWDAELYDNQHSFVSKLGSDLIELLSPQTGEYILDLGCGTGHLTKNIATYGVQVLGIDSAESMIVKARSNYPQLKFEVADATNLQFTEEFDAVFSNAVLHWIKQPEKVISGIYRSLKTRGRFVAEFGGKGNVQKIVTAIYNAMDAAGYPLEESVNIWYFPSIGEYGTLLEKEGFELTFASLFERPTPLDDSEQGIQNWIKMFVNNFLTALPDDKQTEILGNIEQQLRPDLYKNGTWFADYKRIRLIAKKV